MAWVYPRLKKWDMGITINGFLGGLVAITCPCYWVNATGAVIIGAIAGLVVVLGIDLIEHLRIDDPIGAVAVHGMCRHLGHLEPRPVLHRSVRRPERACSGAAARRSSSSPRSGATPSSASPPSSSPTP